MERLKKLKPAFWDHQDVTGDQPHATFNFRRKWKLLVLFTSLMALLPLLVMTLMDFGLTRRIIEKEVNTSMSKIVQAAGTIFSACLEQKKPAMTHDQLSSQDRLASLCPMPLLKASQDSDIFLIGRDGTILTPSFYYGESGDPQTFNMGLFTEQNGFISDKAKGVIPVIASYTKIPDSPFTMIMVKSQKELTDLWLKPRLKLVGYLVVSIGIIILSIMGTATYLVRRIHAADQNRSQALHHAEYTKKLASIGRLASGVAHEINNPLAIINQKTGLIVDLFTLKKESTPDPRLIPLANDVLEAVKRCGTITRRLLDFARHTEPSKEPVNIKEVLDQVLAFHREESERRNIAIAVDIKKPVPLFECDKGSLQQIFLNLVENAFAAMEDNGRLNIMVQLTPKDMITLSVSDTGCGISQEEIPKIFEPFYSSKNDHWGTGLGLSTIYGLIKELGGDIMVKSQINKGSHFTVKLPLMPIVPQDSPDDVIDGVSKQSQ